MSEVCTYCKSGKPRGWQGDRCWCSEERCYIRHLWATEGPSLELPESLSPMDNIVAWLIERALRPLVRITPAEWIIWSDGWRERFAVWVYGTSYYWGSRAYGMREWREMPR